MFAALLELVFYTYETNTREKEVYIMENIFLWSMYICKCDSYIKLFDADYGQIHKFLYFIDIHYKCIEIMDSWENELITLKAVVTTLSPIL